MGTTVLYFNHEMTPKKGSKKVAAITKISNCSYTFGPYF